MSTYSSLAALRADAGMTQRELASAVGVGQGRISEWESGAREMSATACWKVARALGVDPGRVVEAVAMPGCSRRCSQASAMRRVAHMPRPTGTDGGTRTPTETQKS